MKCLISGAYGLVGSACMEYFGGKGWDVVGLDNNGRHGFFGTAYHYAELDQRPIREIDIRDVAALEQLFSEHHFDAIIHAAGQPSHDYATDHVLEDFHVNATGTVNLLEATRKNCPLATFIYVSTDKVYGENMRDSLMKEEKTRYTVPYCRGYTEDLGLDFAGDRSFFGCSKAAADMYAQQYAARGMNVGIFRPGCITGSAHAGAEQHGFLAYLAKCIKEGKTYTIYGSGKQVRDQIHASDLAQAFSLFLEKPQRGGVYNIGGGDERSVSVLEAIALFEEKLGVKAQVQYGPERQGDRQWDVHDISKFRREYPAFDYKYSLSDIIADLCA